MCDRGPLKIQVKLSLVYIVRSNSKIDEQKPDYFFSNYTFRFELINLCVYIYIYIYILSGMKK